MELNDKICALAYRYKGEWEGIAKGLRDDEKVAKIVNPVPYVTWADEAYPTSLRRLRFPPWILFYQGNLDLLTYQSTGIVGSRLASAQGLQQCRQLCLELKDEVLVSGLAKGIDAQVHWTALEGGYTIGVAGAGLQQCYPSVNKQLYQLMAKTQLLLSEYPPEALPLAHHFPWRNRLIAALSSRIVVIEAKYHSGTMHTVNEALELSCPVYCLNHPNQSWAEGTNLLIEQGAIAVNDIKELKKGKIVGKI